MYNMVSSDYFRTMCIPLIRGRVLTQSDTQAAPWVVVINKVMAHRFWPDEDPIGKVITIKTIKEERPRQIVGVVGDVRQWWRGDELRPEFYAPFEQQPPVYGDGFQNRVHRFVAVRTALKPESVMAGVRAEVLTLHRDQPVYDLRTMDELARSINGAIADGISCAGGSGRPAIANGRPRGPETPCPCGRYATSAADSTPGRLLTCSSTSR
jgi:putative ABC transport system permease protein